jgi:hypothetical protein
MTTGRPVRDLCGLRVPIGGGAVGKDPVAPQPCGCVPSTEGRQHATVGTGSVRGALNRAGGAVGDRGGREVMNAAWSRRRSHSLLPIAQWAKAM